MANAAVHESFCKFGYTGWETERTAIGRYVLMPDHIHLFVTGDDGFRLEQQSRMLKSCLGKTLKSSGDDGPCWQRGFFDHAVRTTESCSQKWDYIRRNPVRAGFVAEPEDWPYQGEIVPLDDHG